MRAHNIASDFDRAGLGLAGIAAGFIQDAQQRQADRDYEQSLRNQSAAGRAMAAVTRQRAALQVSVDEAADLRQQVARLQRELAAARAQAAAARAETAQMHRRALKAEGLVLRAARTA
ncbi:response regulator receiver protein [Methylobacterium brachiatum]|uniref:response regulator receiver protein n=1 Tax=Methylobacterium brachiatum TaxID=269660 RepID=UPI00244C419B|nr:response regulator receiver protein [Methylobacterium brachiatum]MDH2309168.1 response regulator receiver protein [Methylobacterium brachiatum]